MELFGISLGQSNKEAALEDFPPSSFFVKLALFSHILTSNESFTHPSCVPGGQLRSPPGKLAKWRLELGKFEEKLKPKQNKKHKQKQNK